jgi:hypothetical protein
MDFNFDNSVDFKELAYHLDFASFDLLMDTTVFDSISIAL